MIPKIIEAGGGAVVNMSSGGVSMRLHPAAMGERGENCRLKLELDHQLFEIDASIAHFWSGPQYATCGVALKFPDAQTQKAFRQLVEPVALGAILQPLDPKAVEQDAPGFVKEQYAGDEDTLLTVWRDPSGKIIEHFELQTHDYFIRGSVQTPGLQIGYQEGKPASKGSGPATGMHLTPTQVSEVRHLFLLIVPNLSKAVPADVRAFLERFAT